MVDPTPIPNPQDPYGSFIAYANWAKNIVGQTNANIEALKAGGGVSNNLMASLNALQSATTGLLPIVDVIRKQDGDPTANWYQGELGQIQDAAGTIYNQVWSLGSASPDPTVIQSAADQIAGALQQIIASSAVAGDAAAAGSAGSAAAQAQAQQAASDAAARALAAARDAAAQAAAAASYGTSTPPAQTTPAPVSTTPATGTTVPSLPPVPAGTTPPPIPVARASSSGVSVPWIVGGVGIAILGLFLLRGSR